MILSEGLEPASRSDGFVIEQSEITLPAGSISYNSRTIEGKFKQRIAESKISCLVLLSMPSKVTKTKFSHQVGLHDKTVFD